MACYHPMDAYQSKHTGRVRVVGKKPFITNNPDSWKYLQVPCGQCIGCRLEYSRQWAVRCMHEASCYDNNCFVTLTYDDDHLPDGRSLDYRHCQLFFKRLRKEYGAGIRFYMCGEYGEQFGRPHYHYLIFNFDFPDKKLWKRSASGELLYRSASLEKLWKYGFSSIGALTWNSAAYTARYIMKKVNGNEAKDHYHFVDDNGKRWYRLPEFTEQSRMPGIGKPWLEKFSSDVYPSDFVILNGRKFRPPRYYDTVQAVSEPELMEGIKERRIEAAKKHADNNTKERLSVREKVQEARLAKLRKSL